MRTFLEFIVQVFKDHDRPLPRFLAWLAERDSQLRESLRRSQSLDRELRTGALARRDVLGEQTKFASPMLVVPTARLVGYSRRHSIAWFATLAASLVGVAAFIHHWRQEQTKAAHAQLLSTQLAAVPGDMLSVIRHVARSPQEYSPLARLSFPEVNLWSAVPRGTQGQLKSTISTWGSELSALGERVYQRLETPFEDVMN